MLDPCPVAGNYYDITFRYQPDEQDALRGGFGYFSRDPKVPSSPSTSLRVGVHLGLCSVRPSGDDVPLAEGFGPFAEVPEGVTLFVDEAL